MSGSHVPNADTTNAIAPMRPAGDAFGTPGAEAHEGTRDTTTPQGSGMRSAVAALCARVIARLRARATVTNAITAASGDSACDPTAGGDARAAADRAALPAGAASAQAGATRSRARRLLPALIGGAVVAGSLASSAIAWSMLGARNAEAEAKVAALREQSRQLEEQQARLAEQAARIEVLSRATPESGSPQASADAASTTSPAAALVPPPPAPPPAPAGTVAPPQLATVQPPMASGAAVSSASPVGSGAVSVGLCDIPAGPQAAAATRKCIEWFSRADRGSTAARP